MKLIETDLPGCIVIEPQVFGDDHGSHPLNEVNAGT